MITKKQLKIFGVFAKNPFKKITRKELKKESGEKSNNILTLTIKQLKKEQVLLENKIGKSGLLYLNLNNELTFYYIALFNEYRIPQKIKESLTVLKNEINEKTLFYSIIIFGSYASGEQRKESDIDIAIIIELENNKKRIKAMVNNALLKTPVELDIHIITKKEMLEMLLNKEENLGKQIARKHLSYHNHTIFYEILKEAANHGFRT